MKEKLKRKGILRPLLKKYAPRYLIGVAMLYLVDWVGLLIPQFTGEITDGLAAHALDARGVQAEQEELQQDTLKRFIGSEEEILVESLSKRSKSAVSGKGRHAVSITVNGSNEDIGQILKCRVTGLKNNTLTGERI